jgi:hypothetical protein
VADAWKFEALYTHALVVLADADRSDATQMPPGIMARMYGPRMIKRLRAGVTWVTALLVAHQSFGTIKMDEVVRAEARRARQMAAGWSSTHLYSSPYGRHMMPEIRPAAVLRHYYGDLNNVQDMMQGERLAPTVGDAYPGQLIKQLFELSIVLEVMHRYGGEADFPTKSLADEWMLRIKSSDVTAMGHLLERIVAPQLAVIADRPYHELLQDDGYAEALMSYVRDHLAAATRQQPGKILPGKLSMTHESIILETGATA